MDFKAQQRLVVFLPKSFLRGAVGNLQYELGAYYMEKDDVIFQDANRFNISGASTLHYGLDVSLRWQFATDFDFAVDATLARHDLAALRNRLDVRRVSALDAHRHFRGGHARRHIADQNA